jgi:hypothetical protein
MSRTPRCRSKRATLLDTADWLEPISLLAALKEPASTVRTNATRPVVFSRIEVIYVPLEQLRVSTCTANYCVAGEIRGFAKIPPPLSLLIDFISYCTGGGLEQLIAYRLVFGAGTD